MPKNEELLVAVCEILFREWDPIGVNDNEACRDEYDTYAPAICRRLQEGADDTWLAAHLTRIQRDSMGISHVDEELHKRVARRLRTLVD